jgi:hypothetical protein
MMLNVTCRSNVDFVFALKESKRTNRVRIWEDFFGMFDRKQEFMTVFDQCTQNYECLVLDNTTPNTNIEGCIYWYKANPQLPSFLFGSPTFHAYSQRGGDGQTFLESEEDRGQRPQPCPPAML